MPDRATNLQGRWVKILATDNKFAREHVGKLGRVVGFAPLGMIRVDLDDGTADYWAEPRNVAEVKE